MDDKEIVSLMMDKRFLISSDLIGNSEILSKLNDISFDEDIAVISSENIQYGNTVNHREFEKINAYKQMNRHVKITDISEVKIIKEKEAVIALKKNRFVDIISNYDKEPKKVTVQNFVKYFNNRLKQLEGILRQRRELSSVTSISRILAKKEREDVAVIGMVKEVRKTKNDNIMIVFEDKTGTINVLINKNKPELYELGLQIIEDDVLGIVGSCGDKIIFASNVYLPDVSLNKELKKCGEEVYAAFISDIHIGSTYFLEKEWTKFIKWINREVGSDTQKDVAHKIKYLFITGDLVDGVGIYPGHEDELSIKDIYGQYKEAARWLDMIPKDITIVMCPGNHDACRLAEPQLPVSEDLAPDLYKMENLVILSNPSLVNIHAKDGFPGFDVLLYHGYSFDHYANNVEFLRNQGGYRRADLVMKFLLQRRHLAPAYSSTLTIPDEDQDPLVISRVPDIFAIGHIHYSVAANYRNVTMICSSCWQSITAFQEKLGHDPEPGRVPIVNLQTREVKVINFASE